MVSGWRALPLLALLVATPLAAQPADVAAYGRRLYQDKAQCSFCHGWAGDGAGEPQAPAGANLRQSHLDRGQLVEVIMCGRPGKPMPAYDELAYSDRRCYGVTEAELGGQVAAMPPSGPLQKREVEAISDYLLAKVVGRGAVTRGECEEMFGAGARSCARYPEKQ